MATLPRGESEWDKVLLKYQKIYILHLFHYALKVLSILGYMIYNNRLTKNDKDTC